MIPGLKRASDLAAAWAELSRRESVNLRHEQKYTEADLADATAGAFARFADVLKSEAENEPTPVIETACFRCGSRK